MPPTHPPGADDRSRAEAVGGVGGVGGGGGVAAVPAVALGAPPSPRWRWSYVAFRFGDGATQALISLAVVLHYGLPLWALAVTTACMNLVGVPAAFLWGAVMDRAAARRRAIAVGGFAVAAAAMAMLAAFPPFPLYVAAAMLYTVFGVATAPAASILALQGVPQSGWAAATSSLSRSTGFAFVLGMAVSVAAGFAFAEPPFALAFGGSALTASVAALVAARTIPAAAAAGEPVARRFDPEVVAAGERRFDRPVFFPARLRHSPTLNGLLAGLRARPLLPVGTMLTFTGSVSFFTSYPGVLANEVGLSAGLVLLCQAPSHIVSPLSYPWAARHGSRMGKSRSVAWGGILRLIGIPALCGAIVLLGSSAATVPAMVVVLVLAHALMGLSFALIQVNGPLVLAEEHPAGKGQGVGLFHAALGAGTLVGSVSAFLLLRAFDYWVSYEFALALTLVGVLLLVRAHRGRPGRPEPAMATEPLGPGPAS